MNSCSRRQAIASTLALAGAALAGCNKPPVPEEESFAKPSYAAPLRVLVIGDAMDAPLMERAWSASHEALINVRLLSMDRADFSTRTPLRKDVEQSDVLIYPLICAGELAHEELIAPLDVATIVNASDEESRLFPPAIRSGLIRFANEEIALPLGGLLPSIISATSVDAIRGWQDYHDLVKQWDGKAAEPTAPGWAAMMYLWRCSSSIANEWLFDRETLVPNLTNDAFVSVLDQMIQTHALYETQQQTPSQIWDAIVEGKHNGGITWPTKASEAFPDVSVSALPTTEISRVIFDIATPLASIAASCRQSAFAKEFLAWLLTDDGVRALGQSMNGTIETSRSQAIGTKTVYREALDEAWQSPIVHPSLQLLRGPDYYAALDREVTAALQGEKSAQGALESASSQWRKMTDSVGVKVQSRVWNQAQGRAS